MSPPSHTRAWAVLWISRACVFLSSSTWNWGHIRVLASLWGRGDQLAGPRWLSGQCGPTAGGWLSSSLLSVPQTGPVSPREQTQKCLFFLSVTLQQSKRWQLLSRCWTNESISAMLPRGQTWFRPFEIIPQKLSNTEMFKPFCSLTSWLGSFIYFETTSSFSNYVIRNNDQFKFIAALSLHPRREERCPWRYFMLE